MKERMHERAPGGGSGAGEPRGTSSASSPLSAAPFAFGEVEAVLDMVPVGVWIARDPARGVEANAVARQLMRVAPGEPLMPPGGGTALQGLRVLDAGGAEIAFDALPLQRALRGETLDNYEVDLVFPDGVTTTLRGGARPLRDAHGAQRGAIAAFTDITGRRAAEAELRRSEERLRHLADAMPQLVWTADREGRVDYYNARRTQYHGIAEQADGAWDWAPLVHPDDLDRTQTIWSAAAASGEPYACEHRLKMKGGKWAWHISRAECVRNAAGDIRRWYGTATNIEELKSAQSALETLNATLAERIESAVAERKVLTDVVEGADAFVQVVDMDRRWLAINRSAAAELHANFGVVPAVGARLEDMLIGQAEMQQRVRGAWKLALAGTAHTSVNAFGERYYESHYNVLRDAAGRQIGAYQFAYDVTDRVHDQQRLREAEEALRQAQKMEAVGQLTGGVAHDFNNLLMALSSGLHLLQKPMNDERRARVMDGMQKSVERGAGLTRQLLAFSRRRPLDPKPLDLRVQLPRMRELLDRSLRGDVQVSIAVPAELWAVEADEGELELAVLNLCVNARDAMPNGGRIVIAAADVPAGTGPLAGDGVQFSVTDEGIGMPADVVARAFEPFFTTKEVGKGSGLGLAQVYAFASHSGGHASIHSRPGRGTTITVTLPRSGQSAPVAPAAGSPAPGVPAPGAARGRILFVEDDAVVAALTREALANLGYAVTPVASAAAALAILPGGGFDLVFSDVMMPGGVSGIDLARHLRQTHPHLPVVLATGYPERAREAEAEGFTVLVKPYPIDQLAAVLARVQPRAGLESK